MAINDDWQQLATINTSMLQQQPSHLNHLAQLRIQPDDEYGLGLWVEIGTMTLRVALTEFFGGYKSQGGLRYLSTQCEGVASSWL